MALTDELDFIHSLVGAWDCCGTCAGGVLARRDRRIKAEVLREAADFFEDELLPYSPADVRQVLNARADEIGTP